MKKTVLVLAASVGLFAGCNFSTSTNKETKEVNSTTGQGLTDAIIKNDIQAEASGVKVTAIYLVDDQNEPLKSNNVALNQEISCRVELDTGWTKVDGKSWVGISEQIQSGSGKIVLDAADLLSDYDSTGVAGEDAEVLSASATITQLEEGVSDYIIHFRMWDKKGKGEVKGSYTLIVK